MIVKRSAKWKPPHMRQSGQSRTKPKPERRCLAQSAINKYAAGVDHLRGEPKLGR